MQDVADWNMIPVPDIGPMRRPVFLRAQFLLPHEVFPPHTHAWHELLYAASGTLDATVENIRYVITPDQGIWLPAGARHFAGALNGATFRSLYIAASPDLDMPAECTILTISPFMRALIAELNDAEGREEEDGYIERLTTFIIDQLQRLKPHHFKLPWPKSKQLRVLCEHLFNAPGDSRTVEQWGAELGLSPRTLARRFEGETGMTFREWRGQMRLFRAIELLEAGRDVTGIAIDLGYASTSSFSFMFRQEMGWSPTAWRRR